MTRFAWLGRATPQPWRSRHISTSVAALNARRAPAVEWPQLRRRQRPTEIQIEATSPDGETPPRGPTNERGGRGRANQKDRVPRGAHHSGRSEIDWSSLSTYAHRLRHGGSSQELRGPQRRGNPLRSALKDDTNPRWAGKNMLVIRGTSHNLMASDFYRLQPSSLSSWGANISKILQHRDPKTLEPTGCYQLFFANNAAASAYASNLHRIQNLARHKLQSPNGLWTATVPPHLLVGDSGPGDPEREANSLTIASPSQPNLPIAHKPASAAYPWATNLSELVQPLGYGPRPPVVLIDVFPGGMFTETLAHLIRLDGYQRDLAWSVSEPVPIATRSQDAATAGGQRGPDTQDEDEHEMEDDASTDSPKNRIHEDFMGSRFVIACETECEARRFRRQWNGRHSVSTRRGWVKFRYMIKAEVINW